MEYPFKDLLPLDEVLEREGYYRDWTHLDPEVFYSLTQISEYIKTKGFGVDVRLLIAQLAEHFGLKTTQVVDLANLLQQKFTNLEGVTQSFTNNINLMVAQMEAEKNAVIANATVDSEVILARGGKATLQARLDDSDDQLAQKMPSVNIKRFGAVGDNLTDDTQAIKDAISYITTVNPRPSLYIPEGTYLISEPLDISLSYGKIFGSAMGLSIIKAIEPMEKMFNFTPSYRVNEFIMRDFKLDGNNLADIGIYMPKGDHSYFTQLRIMNTLTDGIVFSGWCNTFTGNRIHANVGNGIRTINKDNNHTNIFQNKIYGNGGIGIVLQRGALINVDGNNIEQNKKTGIYVVGGVNTLNIKNNYFEANALDGLNMVVGAEEETYKTDVFINGRLDENIFSFGSQDMNYNIGVIGNYHYVNRIFCYFLNAVDTITIENNETINISRLIGYIENIELSKVVNLVVGKNYLKPTLRTSPDEASYFTNYEFLPEMLAGQSPDMHTWKLLNSNSFNTFDLLSNGIPSKLATGVTDSVEVLNDRSYMGKRLFKLIKPYAGFSNAYGYEIDLDKQPEMRGAYIYVTMSFFTGQTNVVPSIRVGNTSYATWLTTNNKIEPNKWKTLSYGRQLGTSGKVFVGGGVKQNDGDSEIIMTYPTITVYNKIVPAVIKS